MSRHYRYPRHNVISTPTQGFMGYERDNTYTRRNRAELTFRLSDNNVVAFFDTNRSYTPTTEEVRELEREANKMQVGKRYFLQAPNCEDCTMPKKVYETVAVVDEYNGVKMDSVVMKQVEGETSTIFSLTRNDCRNLGIDFQPSLQLFPQGMNWQNEEPRTEIREARYDSQNLATYPCDFHTRKIRRMMCKLSGFEYAPSHLTDMIGTPDGIISNDRFWQSLTVTTKTRTSIWNQGVNIPFTVMLRNTIGRGMYGDNLVLIKNNTIILELNFDNFDTNGIDPSIFEGKEFAEMFQISYAVNMEQTVVASMDTANSNLSRLSSIVNQMSRNL